MVAQYETRPREGAARLSDPASSARERGERGVSRRTLKTQSVPLLPRDRPEISGGAGEVPIALLACGRL
jgi:hypothetical protein